MFTRILKRGDRGGEVKLAQEWLSHHGLATSVDAAFGPATEACVRKFQKAAALAVNGQVDTVTGAALLAPLTAALKPQAPGHKSLAALTVAYARQHLKQHPIEIGGENRGPWVRLYMEGEEGAQWPWCAGFAMFVVRQAAQTRGEAMPLPYVFGCDHLADLAKAAGRFLRPKSAADYSAIRPGYLFLVRRNDLHWSHVGIVAAVRDGETIETIEGNTNDSGSPEGFEVCQRTRGIKDKDFLII
ncbi:MAG: peptidoglycan-binding protein [Bryobacterales bacterium]|nr:peptidoglycan-binding protein [Bryobacterales bacterium]